jgi:hypothetical protein
VEALEDSAAQSLSEKYDILEVSQDHFKKKCLLDKTCPKASKDSSQLRQLNQLDRWLDESEYKERPINDFSQKVSQALRSRQDILVSWLAYRALYEKRWTQLFELGKRMRRRSWSVVAHMNLRETPSFEVKRCLLFFTAEVKRTEDFYKTCRDAGLRHVVEGLQMLKNKKRPSDRFWEQVNQIKRRRQALNINARMWFMNDVKAGFDFSPSLSEMYFFLPENAKYLSLIEVDQT